MPFPGTRGRGRGGSAAYGLGPATNTFADVSARDTYAGANAAWLTEYNDNRGFWIRVGTALQRRNAAGTAWETVTPVVQGPPGPLPTKATNATVDAETDDTRYMTVAKTFRAIARKVKNASTSVPRWVSEMGAVPGDLVRDGDGTVYINLIAVAAGSADSRVGPDGSHSWDTVTGYRGIWANGNYYKRGNLLEHSSVPYFVLADVGPSRTAPPDDATHFRSLAGDGSSLSDAQIGAKAFRNPPGDLTSTEQDAVKAAIGAGIGLIDRIAHFTEESSGGGSFDTQITLAGASVDELLIMTATYRGETVTVARRTSEVQNVSFRNPISIGSKLRLYDAAANDPMALAFFDADDDDNHSLTLTTYLVRSLATLAAYLPTVTQAEAEAGTLELRRAWTPQRVAQAIAALATGGANPYTPTVANALHALQRVTHDLELDESTVSWGETDTPNAGIVFVDPSTITSSSTAAQVAALYAAGTPATRATVSSTETQTAIARIPETSDISHFRVVFSYLFNRRYTLTFALSSWISHGVHSGSRYLTVAYTPHNSATLTLQERTAINTVYKGRVSAALGGEFDLTYHVNQSANGQGTFSNQATKRTRYGHPTPVRFPATSLNRYLLLRVPAGSAPASIVGESGQQIDSWRRQTPAATYTDYTLGPRKNNVRRTPETFLVTVEKAV